MTSPMSALRVGGYFRKSKVVEDGTRALSIETQDGRYRRWCDREGITPDPALIFKDNMSAWHASGKTRDDFDRALKAMEDGALDVLWCPSIDRLSRGGAGVVMTLVDQGKRFFFDAEQLDSSVPANRALIALFAEIARDKSDQLSFNVRHNKEEQRTQGAWLGAAPYGTRVVGTKQARRLVNDPETWPVVVRIYTERAQGRSEAEIADGLTADGIPAPGAGRTRKGEPVRADWSRVTVYIMVRNPVYEGWLIVRSGHKRLRYHGPDGKPVRCFHPDAEVIPAELAERARNKRLRAQYVRKGRGYSAHTLTGLLRCVGCNAKMPVNNADHWCGTEARGLKGRCPNPVKVKREPLEAAVWDRVISRLINAPDGDPLIIELSARWEARQKPQDTAELQEARQALKAAEDRVQRVMEDREAGYYVGPATMMFQRHHAEALAEWETATARIASLSAGKGVDYAGAVIQAYTSPEADRKELLNLAIDRITVNADGSFRITWVGE